jgi:[glutamine synthetase] adenylyltransferase / [glutamine synthetase]-adenylyl-L-tyrosine phosphorylase
MTRPSAILSGSLGVPRASSAAERLLKEWLDGLDVSLRETLDEIFTADSEAKTIAASIAACSPFLWKIIRRHPLWLARHLIGDPLARLRALSDEALQLSSDLSIPEAMTRLRALRLEFALAAALADLRGLDVTKGMEALTDFADAAVTAALRGAIAEMIHAGRIPPSHGADIDGFFILALGKHGARELNYSSDIDLVVLFEADRFPVVSGREIQPVAVALTQELVRRLHEVTPAGYVFRVDLRLRPDPASTAIAMPVAAALNYYETLGQNWERAAYIKARVIAGDHAAGAAFLKALQPFIWRKYFDYAAIADIHAMKRQINAHRGFGDISVAGHDIKLGRGGIREIEFFVQTQQLVFGGRRANLRGSQTLIMLTALGDEGWVDKKAVTKLSTAYCFLRSIEHRLQMINDAQTQRLPDEGNAFDQLAAFCGFTPAKFSQILRKTFETVAKFYARLFEDADQLALADGSLVFTGADHDRETLATLQKIGFRDAVAASELIRGWHFGRRPAITTNRAREVLTEITPALIVAIGHSADADAAMQALDALFGRATAVVELLSLLKSNPALLSLFAAMLGSAPRLAETVARRPHVLDHLIDPDFARRFNDADRKASILAPLLRPMRIDLFLDVLRDVVSAEKFAVGARMMSGVIDPVEAGPAYSLLAEAAIEASVKAVRLELEARYGIIADLSIAVLGLGKLGSREMTTTSDLDLVIIYDAPENAISFGPKPIEASEFCARLTQRLVAALSAPTARGVAYEIDLRLRPSGNKGPVALPLSQFITYQKTEAETWEQMALCRARAVAGDRNFCEHVTRKLRALITMQRDHETVRREVHSMRQMIADEKGQGGPFDFKIGKGALVDIEFIAQALVLCHASEHTALSVSSTQKVLVAAGQAGVLSVSDAALLQTAWRDWTSLAQVANCWFGTLDHPPSALQMRALAKGLHLPNARALHARIDEMGPAVRACFERILAVRNRPAKHVF